MERIYRQLWNEAGEIKGERYSQRLSEYRNGTITLKRAIYSPQRGRKTPIPTTLSRLRKAYFSTTSLKKRCWNWLRALWGNCLKKTATKKATKRFA